MDPCSWKHTAKKHDVKPTKKYASSQQNCYKIHEKWENFHK